MTAPTDNLPLDPALRDLAVAWHVRLASDGADGDDWLEFEAWLSEAPENLRAYEAVETVWAELDHVTPAPSVLPFRPKATRRPTVWLGAIAASLVATVIVGSTLWSNMSSTQAFDTARGERRVVELADGSHITLNGDSHLTATLSRRERRVVMADAEAVFDVAKDPSRPFFIQAGDREIRVVGTQFNVLHHDGEVTVTVRRGIVEVRPAGEPASPPLARLTKGQGLSHREGQTGDRIGPTDPEAAFAWTEGRLVFRGERLADVAATLNRYGPVPIVVSPAAADLPVTAVLNLGAQDDMLRTLATFLPVQSRRSGDSIELGLRREAR